MEEKQLYPNFIQAVGLMCMIFIGAMIFAVISRELDIAEGTVLYAIVKSIASVFIYYFPIYYMLNKNNETVRQVLSNNTWAKQYIIPAIVLIAGFNLLLFPIEFILKHYFYGTSEIYLENTIKDLVAIPFTIFLFPAFEEILFRGIILRSFLKRYSIVKSVILSSVIFGLMHISLTAIINAMIISVIISYLYIKTKSVCVCILAHSITNILSIGYIDYLLMHYLHFTFSTYVIAGIILAAIGYYALKKAHTIIGY